MRDTAFTFKYPLAARIVNESFYVDDAGYSINEAIEVYKQLQSLFDEGVFLLRK